MEAAVGPSSGCPESPQCGALQGAIGRNTALAPSEGCRTHRCPPALTASEGCWGSALWQALCLQVLVLLLMQSRISSAPPQAHPVLAWGWGAPGSAAEALRRGRSGVSRRIPFQTCRKAKTGNILSLLLCCLLVIRDFLVKEEMPVSEVELLQGPRGSYWKSRWGKGGGNGRTHGG